MKDLLAVITPVPDGNLGCAADYTLALASRMEAHVTFLIAEIEPDISAPMAEPDNMQSCSEIIDVPTRAERVARTIELAQTAAKLKNVSCTVLENFCPPLRDLLIDKAQVHDCTILDVQGSLQYPRQGLIEGVLFGSGRPIIIVPPAAFPLEEETVLVAWDATPAAARALHDALPLLVQAREVFVVSVTDDKEFRAVDSGPHVCRYLSRWNVKSRFELTERGSRGVGDVLIDYAGRVKANLIVMGGFGHPREREFLFGSATRDIFQSNLDTAVLLSH
jgi:nucleotide-binding universal stress UspA family protein